MAEDDADSIQVVAVTDTDRVVGNDEMPTIYLWAAALPRDQAVAAVLKAVPRGWYAKLTDRRLTQDQLARLRLRPGDVKPIG